VYNQESQKVQQKREVVEGKSGECKGDWSRALQKIPQINYTMEYVTTYLQEIPQRIR